MTEQVRHGVVPNTPVQAAVEYLASRGITEPAVVEAARPWVGEGRLWLPWLDSGGEVIYATGRSMNGQEPKYKHRKGERPPLYAAPGAWEYPTVVLVEGHLDALAAAQAGIPGFATTTSELSEAGAEILRDKDLVIAVPDQDAAGETWLASVVSRLRDVELYVGRVPEPHKDLADVAAAGGDVGAVLEDLEQVSPYEDANRIFDGLAFGERIGATVTPVWGRDTEVVWSKGEPLMLYGPQGVGKTTAGQRLVLALAGIDPQVWGFPVAPSPGRVLYVAADRPAQAARSWWRMTAFLGEDHQRVLRERVLFWRGPLPFDLGQDPDELLPFARYYGATTILLDSLKDTAPDLSKPEIGAAVNRAFQALVAEGVEVCDLHHPRKASSENRKRKPDVLDDIYGSTWLTAGHGSVVLLWGAPGDPVIEVSHLKQPLEEVGPLQVRIDHDTGDMEVFQAPDLLAALRHAARGLDAAQAAWAMWSKDDTRSVDKARRRLERMVQKGIVDREERPAEGGGHPRVVYTLREI